jgi:parallel beta-helix repeat protein
MAIEDDGTAWAWGIGVFGVLGNGNWSNQFAPVSVSAPGEVHGISGGYLHSLALVTLPPLACGDTITADTELIEDLSATGDCLTVSADNITLDCDEFTLTGTNGTGVGILLAPGTQGVTVVDCNVTGFNEGIKLTSAIGNALTGNSASQSFRGIALSSSSQNTLRDNTVSDNTVGIDLRSNSNDNLLAGNTASGNNHGFLLFGSRDNDLSENSFLGSASNPSGSAGINLSSSHDNTVTNNSFQDASIGIFSNGSNGNEISDNTITAVNGGMDFMALAAMPSSETPFPGSHETVYSWGAQVITILSQETLFGTTDNRTRHSSVASGYP